MLRHQSHIKCCATRPGGRQPQRRCAKGVAPIDHRGVYQALHGGQLPKLRGAEQIIGCPVRQAKGNVTLKCNGSNWRWPLRTHGIDGDCT